MKITKEKLCTIVQISYHLLFLGGSSTLLNGYLDEIRKTREEIVKQVDRVEKMVDTGKKTGDNISNAANNLNKQLKKVEKVCRF